MARIPCLRCSYLASHRAFQLDDVAKPSRPCSRTSYAARYTNISVLLSISGSGNIQDAARSTLRRDPSCRRRDKLTSRTAARYKKLSSALFVRSIPITIDQNHSVPASFTEDGVGQTLSRLLQTTDIQSQVMFDS